MARGAPDNRPLPLEALRAFADSASDLVSLHGPDFRFLYVNRAMCEATARRLEDYAGRPVDGIGLPPHLAQLWIGKMEEVARTRRSGVLEFDARLTGGTRVLQAQIDPIFGSDGELQAFLWITRDHTATARAELVREGQNSVMRMIVGGAPLPQMLEAMVRRCEEIAPGRPCSILLTSPDRKSLVPGCAPNLPPELVESITRLPIGPANGCCGAAAQRGQLVICGDLAADPAWAPHRDVAQAHGLQACWSAPIVATDGDVLGTLAMYHRRARAPYERELQVVKEAAVLAAIVIEHWHFQRKLEFQALHDPLTGLLNRRGFERRLSALIESASREGRRHALCYLDMEQFKVVNDSCGHAAGDELLRRLPDVLRLKLRDSATVARVGGDEFAILLEDCDLDDAAQTAQAVGEAVRGFRFVWQQRSFSIGVSVGVVGITAESHDMAAVLGTADAACYVAKDEGPNRVHVSRPHDLAVIRRRGEMRWVERLRGAIERDEFCLHFQSIAALDPARPPAARHELLLRLRDGRGGLVLPGSFIPAAERYHLMADVDQWVVETVLRTLARDFVPLPAMRGQRFGINLSGESLHRPELLDCIREGLARHGVPPSMLYFEITETAAIRNLAAAINLMGNLRDLGCELALDDFGSGMSSFSYLKHLPVDFLKIDGDFVRNVAHSRVDQSIVRAAHTVGQELGIRTIAEHAEDAGALECLRGIGVDYAQGYGIGRPQPLEEFPRAEAGMTRPA